MEKEFIPYEQALALKELGFRYYDNTGKLFFNTNGQPVGKDWVWEGNQIVPTDMVPVPTFSQAFRWFREKYNIDAWVQPFVAQSEKNLTYLPDESYCYFIFKDGVFVCDKVDLLDTEEAELECLKKLIEIVKK